PGAAGVDKKRSFTENLRRLYWDISEEIHETLARNRFLDGQSDVDFHNGVVSEELVRRSGSHRR
ncbi:Hypothetical predicted protein, partial [Podarcis lilfordi]